MFSASVIKYLICNWVNKIQNVFHNKLNKFGTVHNVLRAKYTVLCTYGTVVRQFVIPNFPYSYGSWEYTIFNNLISIAYIDYEIINVYLLPLRYEKVLSYNVKIPKSNRLKGFIQLSQNIIIVYLLIVPTIIKELLYSLNLPKKTLNQLVFSSASIGFSFGKVRFHVVLWRQMSQFLETCLVRWNTRNF